MEIKTSIKNNLCKTFRAAGLPKERTLPIVNEIAKWYRSNGVEWTVDRLKSLHHWYITKLSGEPNIPSWVSTKNGSPKGPFKVVFSMKNIQCALAILSAHTVFFHENVSQKQFLKLKEALHSKEVQNVFHGRSKSRNMRSIPKLEYSSPTLQCLTGFSIPVGTKVIRFDPPTRDKVCRAYAMSWQNLPSETVQLILDSKLQSHSPEVLIHKAYREPQGTLSCIQEESLKARWISNPNRIVQHFLRPLGDVWGRWLSSCSTDVTLNQRLGVLWAKEMLNQGVTLAGVDLTSATDKLNLEVCIDMVHMHRFGRSISQQSDVDQWSKYPNGKEYFDAVHHFIRVSRGDWLLGGERWKWDVGWPLGTRPSFPLLGMVNNLCALYACQKAGVDKQFRVLGDDIVINAKAYPEYRKAIEQLGGVVNTDKTIVSCHAVEFAGHVITSKGEYLKRVKTRDLSDQHFMQIVSTMGEQAKSLLRPRQRKVWNELRFVPGIAVDGANYSKQSYGESLSSRYHWYLKHVESQKVETEPTLVDSKQLSIQFVMSLKEAYGHDVSNLEAQRWFIPRDCWEGIHPSKTAYSNVQVSGDPRLEDGKTTLQVAESTLEKGTFKPYQTFKKEEAEIQASPSVSQDGSSSTPVSIRERLTSTYGKEKAIRIEQWITRPFRCPGVNPTSKDYTQAFKLWTNLREAFGITPRRAEILRDVDNERKGGRS